MDSREFVKRLAYYYNEPIEKAGKPNIRLTYIIKWLEEEINPNNYESLLNKVISEFEPTGVNPMPLIPHIARIAGKGTAEKDKQDRWDAEAKEVISRIVYAIAKIGYVNPDRARVYVGELGWKIVERRGGWEAICGIEEKDLTSFTAQCRDLAKSILYRVDKGMTEKPALPKANYAELANNLKELTNG